MKILLQNWTFWLRRMVQHARQILWEAVKARETAPQLAEI